MANNYIHAAFAVSVTASEAASFDVPVARDRPEWLTCPAGWS